MEISDYVYKCSAGETFDSVAKLLFKDEFYASELMTANPELCRKVRFTGGERLYVPVIEMPEEPLEGGIPVSPPWKE